MGWMLRCAADIMIKLDKMMRRRSSRLKLCDAYSGEVSLQDQVRFGLVVSDFPQTDLARLAGADNLASARKRKRT